jgi:hypothetical protein
MTTATASSTSPPTCTAAPPPPATTSPTPCGAGRIERGDCALRVQVDLVRVGSIGGTQIVDDCRLNTDGLTPCLPANSGTRFRAYGEGDWITEGTPGGGTESLRCAYAVRVNVSVRWVGNALERFTLRSYYTNSDVFHCVDL